MRFLITQSLLSSWLHQWADFSKYDEKEEELRIKAEEDFLRTLRRETVPASEAMQNDIDFKQLVTDIVSGKEPVQNKDWYEPAMKIADIIKGGQLQLALSKQVDIARASFLLYGRLDCLKAGTICDIKLSKSYEVGKYFSSVQHGMCFALVPEAKRFVYLISNGYRIWKEEYTAEETQPITDSISQFTSYLEEKDLLELYYDKWQVLK